VDLSTSALLGTSSVQSVHAYYPFALEDGSRLAPMAAELVDRLAIWVATRWFPGMGAADSHSLRSASYICMQHFVCRFACVPFRRFWGDLRREFMQRRSAALHGALSSYLRDALQEGSADSVACLPVPGLRHVGVFTSLFCPSWLVVSIPFFFKGIGLRLCLICRNVLGQKLEICHSLQYRSPTTADNDPDTADAWPYSPHTIRCNRTIPTHCSVGHKSGYILRTATRLNYVRIYIFQIAGEHMYDNVHVTAPIMVPV
jgi:hypothetical protein